MAAGHTIVDGERVFIVNDFRWQLFWKDKKSAESCLGQNVNEF